MSQTVKIPLDMIVAPADGDVTASNSSLVITEPATTSTTLSGSFDNVTGVLSLSIPNVGNITVSGFPTQTDLGTGPTGAQGVAGRDGVDGIIGGDGQRGADGCVGSQGPIGDTGRTGDRGQAGPQGYRGATGATGPTGADGALRIFMQADEPVSPKPGDLWIKL